MAKQRRFPRMIHILPSISEEPGRSSLKDRVSDARKHCENRSCHCTKLNQGWTLQGDKFEQANVFFISVEDDSETLSNNNCKTSKQKDSSEAKALFPEFFSTSNINLGLEPFEKATPAPTMENKFARMEDKYTNQHDNFEYCRKISFIILGTL